MLNSLLLTAALAAPAGDDLPAPGLPFAFLPRAVTSFGAEVHGGWLYVLGGYHGQPHHYTAAGQSPDFYRISLADPRVVEMLPGVGRVQSVALVRHGEHLIRVGGMLAPEVEDSKGLLSSDRVQRFDPAARTWSDLPDLPAPRSSHDAVVVGDQLLVAGGWDVAGDDPERRWSDVVFALDLTEEAAGWRTIPAPLQARALGVAGTDTHLVLVGGIQPDRRMPGEVHVLELASETWAQGPDFIGEAFGPAAEHVGGRVYVNGMDGMLFSWAVGEDDWRDEQADLTQARFFHQLVTDGESLYALGGITGMSQRGRIRALERIPLTAPAEARVETFSLPFPGRALSRVAVHHDEDVLWVAGGHVTERDHDFRPEAFGDEVWTLNLCDLGWDRRAALPAPRQSMRLVQAQEAGALLAIGGVGHDGEQCTTQAAVWRYDQQEDAWSEAGALPVGRTQVGVAWRGEELLVLGGMVFDPREDKPFAFPAEVFDAAGSAMTELALPEARRSFAWRKYGDRVLVVGGMEQDGVPVDGMLSLDLNSGSWSQLAAPKATRHGASLVPLQGRLLLVGGMEYDEAGHLWDAARSVEAYDPREDSWEVVIHDVGRDLDGAHVFPVGDRLLIFEVEAGLAHLTFLSLPERGSSR